MDKARSRAELERLVAEATRVAPSIANFAGNSYGRVNDTGYDAQAAQRWKLEAVAALQYLASSQLPAFVRLSGEYQTMEVQAADHHSRSIFIHQAKQCLVTALQLLDSPAATALHWPSKAPARPQPEPLTAPEKVTIPWIIRNVSIGVWISAIGLLFAAFALGVSASKVSIIRETFGL